MGKQLHLFGSSSDNGSEKGSPAPPDPPPLPHTDHRWARVFVHQGQRVLVEWICNVCGTRVAPDAYGKLYYLRSPLDCEGKA